MSDRTTPDVLEKEAAFADAMYTPYAEDLAVNPNMFRKYTHPHQFWDWRQKAAQLLGSVEGKSVLDFGCGMGEEAMYFAKLGAKVTAIDISQQGIEITKKRAAFNGLTDRVTALVMQATPTEFPPESFDVVHGLGILHHLDLDKGLQEVKRVLKPGGVGIFLEPMGNSRFIENWKNRIQKMLGKKLNLTPVTEDEENLKLNELEKHAGLFSSFNLYPYRLVYRVRKLFVPRFLHDRVQVFDYYLLRIAPFLKRYAGAVVIHLVK
jgi:SAM-dependent methyltransferase